MLQNHSSKVLPVCANYVIIIRKINFYTAISHIYAQFAPVNKGLHSAYCMPHQLYSKLLPVCANDVIKKFLSLISPLLLATFMAEEIRAAGDF